MKTHMLKGLRPSGRKGLPAALASMLLALSLSGCGPGFPIMTREQEALVNNVDMLLKENSALKNRVVALEKGAADPQIKQDLEGIKKSQAETNSSIDKVRQDLSFVQGSVEEADHGKKQAEDSVKSINETLKSTDARIAALENGIKESGRQLDTIKKSLDADDKDIKDLKDALAAEDKKIESVARASAASSAPAPAPASAPIKKTGEDPEALYMKGYKQVIDKDFPNATENLKDFLTNYPDHKLAGNAQYWLGEVYYAKGDWERAILEFNKVIKKYSTSEKVSSATLKQGFAFEKLGSRKEAKVLFEQVIEKFPNSPEAGLAKKQLESFK